MKIHMQQLFLASLLLGGSSLALAHGEGYTAGTAVFHYLTGPDHVAFICFVAVAVGCFFLRRKRPYRSQQRD